MAVNSTTAGLARLIYPAEAKELADYDVVSNLPPGAPFRGPGGPPMAFALEQAIDEAALRLDVDPIQLRKRWDPNPNRQRLYDWAAGLETWRTSRGARTQAGRYRRGVGVAAGYWLYLWQFGSKVGAGGRGRPPGREHRDAGYRHRDPQRHRRHDRARVRVRAARDRGSHRRFDPAGRARIGRKPRHRLDRPAAVACGRQTQGRDRAENRAAAGAGSNAPWREMIAASPDLKVQAQRPEDNSRTVYGNNSLLKDAGMIGTIFGWMMRRSLHMAIGAGAPSSVQVAEVEVDTLLGHVRVVRMHTGVAVGKIAAPALARSQAAGAIIQGLGYALYEGREVDPRTGDVLTTGLDDYRIPGIADTPLIDVHFDEGGFDHVLGGSVGIGEVATVPTAAAIANAVRDAIGVRPSEIPIRPDRLLGLLKPEDRRMTSQTPAQFGDGQAEFRASGTDLSERRRTGVSRGPLIDIVPTPDMIGIAWEAAGARPDRRLDDDRRDRGRRADRGGLSGNRRRRRRSRDAADPASGDARRQSRAAFALLVFSQPRHRLPEEGRRRLSGARGQPSLRRRVRSRAVRGAAPFDHGDGAAGL